MSNPGMVIESLVAILLLVTIGYCAQLNMRLKRLKADEKTLKTTIAELISATEAAERAIAGLKLTMGESGEGLGDQLRQAERFSADMRAQIGAGGEILRRLAQIANVGRPMAPPAPQPASANAPDAKAVAAAAQAFAARAQSRVNGLAA
jgi:hypothetical protein